MGPREGALGRELERGPSLRPFPSGRLGHELGLLGAFDLHIAPVAVRQIIKEGSGNSYGILMD